jgi:cytochrome b
VSDPDSNRAVTNLRRNEFISNHSPLHKLIVVAIWVQLRALSEKNLVLPWEFPYEIATVPQTNECLRQHDDG